LRASITRVRTAAESWAEHSGIRVSGLFPPAPGQTQCHRPSKCRSFLANIRRRTEIGISSTNGRTECSKEHEVRAAILPGAEHKPDSRLLPII
jgi:hypothetical protein